MSQIRFTSVKLLQFLLLACGLLAPARSFAAPRQVAMLVGISDYSHGTKQGPDGDGFPELSTGPDLKNMEAALKEYGFEVKILENVEATQQNIKNRFREWLVRDAKPDDHIVFYFTGHGHQIPAQNDPSETDNLDEALVTWVPAPQQVGNSPVQRSARHAAMYMRDHSIDALLRSLTANMMRDGKLAGNVTVILDSCCSGNGIKAPLQIKGRPWSEAIDGPMPAPASDASRPAVPQPDASHNDWLDGSMPEGVVFMAAAESNQSAFMWPDPGKGSVFSSYLTGVLLEMYREESAGSAASYRTLFERVHDLTLADHLHQSPQLFPVSDAPIFDDWRKTVTNTPGESYHRVTRVVPGTPPRVLIHGGKLFGATKNSRYNLFPSGAAITDPNQCVAKAVLDEVADYQAVAHLELIKPGIDPATLLSARAVETMHQYEGAKLQIKIEVQREAPVPWRGPALQSMTAFLKGLNFVQVVTTGNFDLKVILTASGHYVYQTLSAAEAVEIGPTFGSQALEERLAQLWRWKGLSLFSTPGNARPTFEVKLADDKVQFDPVTGIVVNAASHWIQTDAQGTQQLHTGDSAFLLVRNCGEVPLYPNVVLLAPDGDIRLLYPAKKSGPKDAFATDGNWRCIGRFTNVSATGKSETYLYKLIAVPQFEDLSGLNTTKDKRTDLSKEIDPLLTQLLALKDKSDPDVQVAKDAYTTWSIATLRVVVYGHQNLNP